VPSESQQVWPEVLLGRLQRFGDVEFFEVPEGDADEYETERYLPASQVEGLAEALEFYAAEVYECRDAAKLTSNLYADGGEKARAALTAYKGDQDA